MTQFNIFVLDLNMCIKQNSSYMAGYQDAVAKFQSIFPAYQDSLVSYSRMLNTCNPFRFYLRVGSERVACQENNLFWIRLPGMSFYFVIHQSYLCCRYQRQDNDINNRQFSKCPVFQKSKKNQISILKMKFKQLQLKLTETQAAVMSPGEFFHI